MVDTSRDLDARLYFGRVSVVVVETSAFEAEILSEIFTGFKVRGVTCFNDAPRAQEHLQHNTAELLVVGSCPANEGELDEYDLIRWVRRSKAELTRTASVIRLAGHTLAANVQRARDCGASFVIAKPATPAVLYERIVWLAKDARAFIDCASYAGPDRRFQQLGPPKGVDGRRHDDLSLTVGAAKAPNMSQSEIDAMLGGKGVAR